jgi:hypothetical protein
VSEADLIITTEDVATVPNWNGGVGLCARGVREWTRARGIDYLRFVRNGIPASELLATGDALAIRVVEHARERRRG